MLIDTDWNLIRKEEWPRLISQTIARMIDYETDADRVGSFASDIVKIDKSEMMPVLESLLHSVYYGNGNYKTKYRHAIHNQALSNGVLVDRHDDETLELQVCEYLFQMALRVSLEKRGYTLCGNSLDLVVKSNTNTSAGEM
jgi:hypothetical protein